MADIFDMADTWNDAGTVFTSIKMDVTDTASNAASLLMDLQVGSASKFSVDKTGRVFADGGSNSVPDYSFVDSTNTGIGQIASQLYLIAGGSQCAAALNGGLRLNKLDFASAPANGSDVSFIRDAANVLAMRQGTTAVTSRVYGTFTDASNYERLAITRDAITVESAGTGTANIDLALTPAGTGVLKFGTHTALGGETVSGYITIKDAGGISRKVAVVS